MRMQKTMKDGRVAVVCSSANGDYIAIEDADGFHHAPPSYVSLPEWDEEEAREALLKFVADCDDDDDE